MDDLSNELIYKIILYLDYGDLINVSLTSKRLHNIVDNEYFWKKKLDKDFIEERIDFKTVLTSKQEYKIRNNGIVKLRSIIKHCKKYNRSSFYYIKSVAHMLKENLRCNENYISNAYPKYLILVYSVRNKEPTDLMVLMSNNCIYDIYKEGIGLDARNSKISYRVSYILMKTGYYLGNSQQWNYSDDDEFSNYYSISIRNFLAAVNNNKK